MAKSYEMYVFDWDGTLMDTTRLIMQGYQHASKALGYPVPSDELVLSTIGLNRSDSIALCCCDCPKGRYSEFIQAYMDWYAKKEAQLELVPGFRQLLENMHKDGKRLAIATGKSREGMKRVFSATGIGRRGARYADGCKRRSRFRCRKLRRQSEGAFAGDGLPWRSRQRSSIGGHSRIGEVSRLANSSKWGRYCPLMRGFPYSLTIDRSEVTPIQ